MPFFIRDNYFCYQDFSGLSRPNKKYLEKLCTNVCIVFHVSLVVIIFDKLYEMAHVNIIKNIMHFIEVEVKDSRIVEDR